MRSVDRECITSAIESSGEVPRVRARLVVFDMLPHTLRIRCGSV